MMTPAPNIDENGFDLSTAKGRGAAERVKQGLPPTIEDRATLEALEFLSRPRPDVEAEPKAAS